MSGKTISKPMHEDTTYEDIQQTEDNLWNFLFFTGYLKAVKTYFDCACVYLTMAIPNMEVRYIYEYNITEWFNHRVKEKDLTQMHDAMLKGKASDFEKLANGSRM